MPHRLIFLFIILLTISCSRSKTSPEDIEFQNIDTIEVGDAEDFDDIMLDGTDSDERASLTSQSDSGLVIEGQDFNEPISLDPQVDPALAGIDLLQETEPQRQSSYKTYNVQKNETLMLISYKIYGDYSRWRELEQINKGRITNVNKLTPGMRIKYSTFGENLGRSANGSPYLIKKNDTLSKVSSKVYGNSNKWRPIWRNNQRMIPNPNKIFAGFTLYYPEL